eukprot:4416782-Amphidinium_carterae.2
MPHSKVCRRGTAVWNVRAPVPPQSTAYPMTAGYKRFSMRIVDPSQTRSSSLPAKLRTSPAAFTGSETWRDALVGKQKELKTPLPLVADSDTRDAAGAQPPPEDSKRAQCEVFNMERPPKKARGFKVLRSDDDDDGLHDGLQDASDMDVREDGEHEEESELGSEDVDELDSQASYGFGSDGEEDGHNEDVVDGDGRAHLSKASSSHAKPKQRAQPLFATPVIPPLVHQEMAAHDSRIAGLEAGLGRMEAMLTSLMTQTQAQQHQLLQQVQAVVQQHIPAAATAATPQEAAAAPAAHSAANAAHLSQ